MREVTLRVFALMAAIFAGLFVSNQASASNLIVNGDFSAGATGFTSDYQLVPYPQLNALFPEGTYTVGADPILDHQYFVSIPGGNQMLLVNGSTVGGDTVYEYTSPQLVAGTYSFGATVGDICCNNTFTGTNAKSELLFEVSTDNFATAQIIKTFTTNPPDGGVLNDISSLFTVSGDFKFRIVDGSLAASGNDFAIDNLSISAVPEPATWAMMIFGFLGLGFLGYRKSSRRSGASFRLA
jgi:hypothetical protein